MIIPVNPAEYPSDEDRVTAWREQLRVVGENLLNLKVFHETVRWVLCRRTSGVAACL